MKKQSLMLIVVAAVAIPVTFGVIFAGRATGGEEMGCGGPVDSEGDSTISSGSTSMRSAPRGAERRLVDRDGVPRPMGDRALRRVAGGRREPGDLRAGVEGDEPPAVDAGL